MKKIFLFAAIVIISTVSFSQTITLVEKGKSDYKIVLPQKSSHWDSLAASELKKYLKEISGVELEIVDDSAPLSQKEILLGNTNRTKDFSVDMEKFEQDGFTIKTSSQKLFIVGGSRRGTLNGVYTFLESYLGCRMYTPQVVVIPKKEIIELTEINTTQIPFFTYRDTNYLSAFHKNFSLWHKLDSDTASRKIWGMFVHTFEKLVPTEKYFKDHPEYFAELNGIRTPGQLCLANPNVLTIVIEDLRKRIKENPEAKIWSVSQNDNFAYCHCEKCKAVDDREETPAGSIIYFVNKVAKEFPDKIISTLAYSYTRKAPKFLRLLPNVNIVLCSIECNRSKALDEDTNSKSFVDDLREWNSFTNNIMIWDYVVQFKNTVSPFPNLHVLQPNLKLFKKFGSKMMFQQGAGHILGSEFGELRSYLISKLLWNPDINIDSVMNDFLSGYYGHAGKHIRKYIDLMHDELKKSNSDLLIYSNPIAPINGHLSARLISSYNKFFDDAEKAVSSNKEIFRRVRLARLPLTYAMLEQAKVIRKNPLGITTVDKSGKEIVNKRIEKLLTDFSHECYTYGNIFLNESGQTLNDYSDVYRKILSRTMHNPFALNAEVIPITKPSTKYPANGMATLTDGLRGVNDYSFNWLGYEGENLEAIIDLNKTRLVKKISSTFLQDNNSWIFFPSSVEYFLSEDGIYFKKAADVLNDISDTKEGSLIKNFDASIKPTKARYVKIVGNNLKVCPRWHKGYPYPCWVFADEVVVE